MFERFGFGAAAELGHLAPEGLSCILSADGYFAVLEKITAVLADATDVTGFKIDYEFAEETGQLASVLHETRYLKDD